MPDFAYVARDMKGKSIAGTITASNQRDAAAQLGSKSLFPISITVNKGSQVKKTRGVGGAQMAGFISTSQRRSNDPSVDGAFHAERFEPYTSQRDL
jgi:type II secretory pathway component PulF